MRWPLRLMTFGPQITQFLGRFFLLSWSLFELLKLVMCKVKSAKLVQGALSFKRVMGSVIW